MSDLSFSIAAVERDTGLSKDVLRMWERRYGFPAPLRGANDERCYPIEQVERLRAIKRLMDRGHRPGKLINASMEELSGLTPRRLSSTGLTDSPRAEELADLLALIKAHDISGYTQAMQHHLARKGLQNFVQDTVAPLSSLIGEEWERGTLEIFEEHLFTELTKRLLRQSIATLSAGSQQNTVCPRILLTSVPGEQHALGLLMAEVMFTLEGAKCIPLGTEMPLMEIARAATAHRANVVALSFSSAFPQRQIPELLRQLRKLLPSAVGLWVGGGGIKKQPVIEGVQLLQSLENSKRAVEDWCEKSKHD